MSTRDFAAELAAAAAQQELELLREMRERILEVADIIGRSNRHHRLTDGEAQLVVSTFDRDGFGPALTCSPVAFSDIVARARRSRP